MNGSRATRARFPNASSENPFLYATGGGFDHTIIDLAFISPTWAAAADAQLNIVPQSRFFNQWNTVTAVNPATGRIDIADSERHRRIDPGSWLQSIARRFDPLPSHAEGHPSEKRLKV